MDKLLETLYRRARAQGSPDLLQLTFAAEVLDAYRGRDGFSVIRSDSAGRVKQEGGWSLDFGIAGDDRLVHASWRDLVNRLPESERDRWTAHALPSSALSANFLQMQMAPGSCFDDGDIRPW
ncbi:MAG TPA: hypothetical protein VFZ12_00630 [Dehalococcoidia bacterium]|nr:hypothetical protein [Dehalococcoidia bacterium]